MLSAPLAPARLLRQLGLRPRKRWSQSFLKDARVLESIVRAAELGPNDEVLEIGPGLGALTARLARRARRVVAVELDPRLAEALGRLVPAPNLTVVVGDALRFDPGEYFSNGYKLVASLPYHLTSPLLLRYLLEVRPPSLMVVTVQREVAERVAAPAGEMGYLSVAVQLVAEPEILRRIAPGAFYPRPAVESAVLRLRLRERPAVAVDDLHAFLRLVLAGFTQPRKQLANSLAQGLGSSREAALELLARAGLDPSRRPQQLTLEQWQLLYQAFRQSQE